MEPVQDESFDAADPAKIRKTQLRVDSVERNRIAALKAVMATDTGRRYIWWLLELCGVFRTSFTGDTAIFFNEGQRNVGLSIISDIHAVCPDLYVTMIQEAKENTNV